MGRKECLSEGKYHLWYGIWIRIEHIIQLLNYLKLWIKEKWHDLNLSTHCTFKWSIHCISLKPEIIVLAVKGQDVKGDFFFSTFFFFLKNKHSKKNKCQWNLHNLKWARWILLAFSFITSAFLFPQNTYSLEMKL